MSPAAVQTGGLYRNKDKFFKTGKDSGLDADKGSRQYTDPGSIELQDGYSWAPDQDDPEAVAYTQSKRSRKGGGFDYGEKRMIYKKVDTPDPETAAPTPEPEADPEAEVKPPSPIELSPEVKQAKERVGAYKDNTVDGTQGTDFTTEETPDAQNFADKYKLNLLNKGADGSDFSGV